MTRRFLLAALLTLLALPLKAQQADQLYDQLQLDEMIAVMRIEGLSYGDSLGSSMFPGNAPAGWAQTVSEIYDADRMQTLVRQRFTAAMAEVETDALLDFFASETGQRVITLELSAREAMIDETVDEAARETWRSTDEDRTIVQQITAFIEANDLIEANVAGALNASYRFYSGMVDGGALEMSESDILADVWGQEEETRSDTTEWLYAFLLMAYQPLDESEMQAYLDISSTDEGRALNRALFDAFNKMYTDISYALGLAVARQMQVQDL